MCLTRFICRQERMYVGKKRFRTTKAGMLVGYKVVCENNRSPFVAGEGYEWQEGINQSSRIFTGMLDHMEGTSVERGFHVLATLKDAQETLKGPWQYQWDVPRKIIRVLVNPRDVVAEGYFDVPSMLCLVCTKCLVESLNGVQGRNKCA